MDEIAAPRRADAREKLLGMTDFGMFYPRGHLIVAFPRREDADRVRRDLLTGGYDAQDCQLFGAEAVSRIARRNLEEHSGFFAALGRSDEAVAAHLAAAERGDTFLIVYAPNDLDAERAMNVVRRVPFHFVHRYHRLAIQILR